MEIDHKGPNNKIGENLNETAREIKTNKECQSPCGDCMENYSSSKADPYAKTDARFCFHRPSCMCIFLITLGAIITCTFSVAYVFHARENATPEQHQYDDIDYEIFSQSRYGI